MRQCQRIHVAIRAFRAQQGADMRSASAPSNPLTRDDDGVAGHLFRITLGLSLVLIGGCFVWLMARSFLRAEAMRSWPEVPCEILVSEIEQRKHDSQSPMEFRHVVTYGYTWKGKPLTSDRVSLRGSPWTSKRPLAEQRAAEYPAGTSSNCRVDPDRPEFAVLKPDSLAPGYSIWFPGLFLVAGIGITVGAFRKAVSHPRRPQALP